MTPSVATRTPSGPSPAGGPPRSDRFERSRRRRKAALLAALCVLLALVLGAIWYYNANRALPLLGLPVATEADRVVPPSFLYGFSMAAPTERLLKPTGIGVARDGTVFVVDATNRKVRVFSGDGTYRSSFNKVADGAFKTLQRPVNVTVGPDGKVYVTDRGSRAVYVFSPQGVYERAIRPKGPDSEFFSPLAITVIPGGDLVLTDVGDTAAHRVLVLAPNGAVKLKFGTTGEAMRAGDQPGRFYFPAGVSVDSSGSYIVSDGDNRRLELFDRKGKYVRMVNTQGVPRGITIDRQGRVYVVNTLAHEVDVFDRDLNRIVTFGGQGISAGQFNFPNGVAIDPRNGHIVITDRENNQIQVWGWPAAVVPTQLLPKNPLMYLWCLLPLLLIPLVWWATRRKTYAITPDSVEALVATGRVSALTMRRTRFAMRPEDHARFEGRVEQDVDLGQVLVPHAYSESDTSALMERLEVGHEEASVLVIAQRIHRIVTEDASLTRLARALSVDVYDAAALAALAEEKSAAR